MYQSFMQSFVSNSGALLAQGSTVDSLAVGQIGILDGKTNLAVTSPTYANNKALSLVWGTPNIDLGLLGGIPNENEYSKLIKGKFIKNFRAKKASKPQSQKITIGWSGDSADTNTLSAQPGDVKHLYLKLTGSAIDKLYSKQGNIRMYSVDTSCWSSTSDCDTSCDPVDCTRLATELAAKINSDNQVNRLIKARAITSCSPALTSTTTNCYAFRVELCDDGTDSALGLVQIQYPTNVVNRVSRVGSTSTYEIVKTVNSAPSAVSNSGMIIIPNCSTCPSGYTLVNNSFVYRLTRTDSGDAGAMADVASRYNITGTESISRMNYEYGQSTYVIVSSTALVVNGTANEVQQLIVPGATAGTFTLTFNGNTTSAIAYNASAATVQTALLALTGMYAGDVVATGGTLPNTAVTLTFGGQFTGTNVPQVTTTSTGLTGGAAVVTTVSQGFNANINEVQTVTSGGTAGTITFTYNSVTTGSVAWNATAATIQTALEGLSTIGAGNVSVTGGILGTNPVVIKFIGALAGQNVSAITLGIGSLTTATTANTYVVTTTQGFNNNTNEVQSIIGTGATSGTFTLSFNGNTTTAIAYNASAATVQTALLALPGMATGDVVATGGALPSTAVVLTFGGQFAGQNVPQVIVNSSTTVAPIVASTTTQGVDGNDVLTLVTNNARQTCVLSSATTTAWALNDTLVKYQKSYRITLADTTCGTSRLADLQTAYPSNVITLVNAAGSCVHTYETTVYSQCVTTGCSLDTLIYTKPVGFEGAIWEEVVTSIPSETTCICGIEIETAFVNRVTNECTFDYFPAYDYDTVFVQASQFEPDWNGPMCSTDWAIKQIRAMKLPIGDGAYVRKMEQRSKSYDLRERSYNAAMREAQGYQFITDVNKYYDEYVIEFDFKYIAGAGWSESYNDSYHVHVFFPEGMGKPFETAVNSYLQSSGIQIDPVIL